MPITDRELPQVVVNKLTQAQYSTATKSVDEFYLVTDAKIESSDIDWSSVMTVLYDNATGTTGDVPLSDSIANYARIKVFYKTSDGLRSSREFYGANGQTITITEFNMTSSGGWIKTKSLSCSNTTLTVNGTTSGQVSLPSTYSVGNSYITILRVEGWKN